MVADALSRLPLPKEGKDSDAVYNISELKLDGMPVRAEDIRMATSHDPVLS